MSGTTKYGLSSLYNNTGPNNSAFGNAAAFNNLDASCNTAIGGNALFYNTNGPHNTAIGAGAMCNNVGGQLNTAVGSSALEGLLPPESVGDFNVAIGPQALYSNKADYNVAVGYQSLLNNSTGIRNVAAGYQSLISNITGSENVAIGNVCMNENTIGSFNVALGKAALSSSAGNNNTAIGAASLSRITVTDGSNNTAIGYESGLTTKAGNNNTFLGAYTGTDSVTAYTTSTAIGYYAQINASHQIVLGTSGEIIKIPGSYVGINGVYNPTATYPVDGGTYALDVSGNINAYYINLLSGSTYTNNPYGLVPKAYVDGLASGITPLEACQCASTEYIDLTANPSTYSNIIDGYTLQNGNRVLLYYQGGSSTTPNVDNGIYVVNLSSTPYWSRSSDMSGNSDAAYTTTFILNGSTNGGIQFVETASPGIVGIDNLIFNIFKYLSNI